MSQSFSDNTRWEFIALAAALIILVSPLLYSLKSGPLKPTPGNTPAQFVGSEKCKQCHEVAYKKWKESDHHMAMATANDTTVLGDFSNVHYTDPYNHVTSRFYRKNSGFFVETEGPDGQMGEFEITYTFGVYPLQQYLIPFSRGRLQCLNIAWDVDKKEWYRLPPYTALKTDDWLHWTNEGQTWNVMCAECHSTNLDKGYNPQTGEYKTTWSEISVGCEACHGPGSKHLAWAEKPPLARRSTDNFGLLVNTRNMTSDEQITVCAPCHSRRFQLGNNQHTNTNLLDVIVPERLNEGLYYPDGQIQDEVYVYGSFVQSKMYQRGVRCSDCHDVHSLKPHKEKNALCTQCHRADNYDTKQHHFHKTMHKGKPSEGYLCVKCHMPGRTYMGIDYRPDHSLRIPRPDLSAELGTPNACSAKGCHSDKPLSWDIENYTKWYGETRKPHYGSVIAAGRKQTPGANMDLIHLAEDTLLPTLVRATALGLLRSYPDDASRACLSQALNDAEPLIRYTAIQSLEYFDAQTRLQRIAPKLYDPVKAVRMESGLMLSMLPEEQLRKDDREAFKSSLAEYRDAMLYNGDLAPQRFNLGNLAANQNNDEAASVEYQKAIAIDSQFYPAKINLAMLYNRQGKNKEAEAILRDVVKQHPEFYEVSYSLGLLLAEMHQYDDAERYLGKAAAGMQYARAYYNQGQVFLVLNKPEQAEQALIKALSLSPQTQEFFGALVGLYLKTRQFEKAVMLAQSILDHNPSHKAAQDFLKSLKRIQ